MPAPKPATWLSISFAALIVALGTAQNVRAQDFDEEPSSEALMADHGGGHHGGGSLAFNIAGQVKVMSTTCGANTCFTIKGKVQGNNEQVFLSAQGTNTNCGPSGNSMCCEASGTETVSTQQGKIKFSFTGTSCSISPKKDTLKIGLTLASGCTGLFAAARSCRKCNETVTDNPANHGIGGVKGSGALNQ